MIGHPEIYWHEQCQYCQRSINTSHCNRNQNFMKKLKSMYNEYLGTVEFRCDYFHKDPLKNNKECEVNNK